MDAGRCGRPIGTGARAASGRALDLRRLLRGRGGLRRTATARVADRPPGPGRGCGGARQPRCRRQVARRRDGGPVAQLDDYDEASAFAQVFDRLNQWSHRRRHEVPGSELAGRSARRPRCPRGLPRLGAEALARAASFDAGGDVAAAPRPALARRHRRRGPRRRSRRSRRGRRTSSAGRCGRWRWSAIRPMVPDDGERRARRWFSPGEILLSGRASAPQRAWMFLELLRHAGSTA